MCSTLVFRYFINRLFYLINYKFIFYFTNFLTKQGSDLVSHSTIKLSWITCWRPLEFNSIEQSDGGLSLGALEHRDEKKENSFEVSYLLELFDYVNILQKYMNR